MLIDCKGMKETLLTIIIPFLNEKEEVRNTVANIRENSHSGDITILLINDASDDGFDYEAIAKEYGTEYIVNPKRLGVAASRDLGVRKSCTKYILLLDAHMRFYNSIWVNKLLTELDNDAKALLCCQTKGLMAIDDKIIEIKNRPTSFGAYIDFYNEKELLECHWIFQEDKNQLDSDVINIPCVLGAAYSCSREYWLYLKGLQGLLFYGNDEAYISMKVWLDGGSCKLLKNVVVGHVYRNSPPYTIENSSRIYNRILISELLLPDFHKARINSSLKRFHHYKDALGIFYHYREHIYSLKKYYDDLFRHDFSYFEKNNAKCNLIESIIDDKKILLQNIAHHIILNSCLYDSIGLLSGKLGMTLFLFHYGIYSQKSIYTEFAETILETVIDNITADLSIEFSDGLTGIGWGIEYLYQNRFIEGDTNDILAEFDKKIQAIGLDTIDDVNLNNRFGGILHYVLARLYTIKKVNASNFFNSDFISRLYQKSKYFLDNNIDSDCLNICLRFIVVFEELATIQQPSIYDITYLTIPQDYQIEKFVLGLDGSAGVGLKLIFEK